MKKPRFVMSILVSVLLVLGLVSTVVAQVEPPEVKADLAPGESMTVTKEVTTPKIPPVVDICLLEDETGSFWDDIANLQGGTTASDIYDTIVAASPNAQFAVAGFRDYPQVPYGSPGDWVYRLLSPMSPLKANWLAGIAALTAGGGNDTPEAQYDAIVAAAGPGVFNDPTLGPQPDAGWRDPTVVPGVQHVLVVTTDAPFHLPGAGKPHVNTQASTIAALNAQNIIVIGLKAPGCGGELDALAAATGGSTQPLSPSGADIAQAILDGLEELTTDVWWNVEADPGLSVTLEPTVHYAVPGATTVTFKETITVAKSAPQCKTITATVTFYANTYPEEGAVIGVQKIAIHVKDVTPPEIWCVESVNPHGKTVPPAGKTTLPGPKGGQNDEGFYQLFAKDNCDLEPEIYVSYVGADPYLFGPFASGIVVKITEAPGAAPSCKKIGSSTGQAGAVSYHITLPSDPVVTAIDDAGNTATCVGCLVPPPPK